MDKTQKTVFVIVAVVLGLVLLSVIAWGVWYLSQPKEFVKPAFEEAAVEGAPTVSDASLRYTHAKLTDELAVGLCATCRKDGDELLIYFTSLEHNTAWVRVKVYDEKGKLRGESGLLRPGEYVERVALSSKPRGETLTIKVLSYEPDTYYSLGTAALTVNVE